MDNVTRKLMTKPKDDIYKVYVTRKEGQRELASNENCVDGAMQGLEEYITKHNKKLIVAVNNNMKTKIK